MKKLHLLAIASLVVSSSLLAICSCTSKEKDSNKDTSPNDFVIEGTLPANRYDNAILYLVPLRGPHPRQVDSVFVGRDGHFRFEGNVEQMAVLRLEIHHRYGIQDLIVCTEPGKILVTLDSISSSGGTPQNDLLQQWKNRQQQYTIDNAMARQLSKSGAPAEEVARYTDSIRTAMGEFNYQLLKGAGRQTVTMFINTMFSGKIDSLRRAELNELLKDTTDYQLPQPGFRR